MNTFSKYATLTTTHDLVLFIHLLQLGWKMLRKVELLMMILLSASLVLLIPPSSGGLTILL